MKIFQCFVFVSLWIFVQAFTNQKCFNNDTSRTDAFATALFTSLEKLSPRSPPLINIFYERPRVSCQQEYIFEKAMEKNREKFLVQISKYQVGDLLLYLKETSLFFTACKHLVPTLTPIPILYYCPELTIAQIYKNVEEELSRWGELIVPNINFLIETDKRFIDLLSMVRFTTNHSDCRKKHLVRTNRFLINESRWLSDEFLTEPQRNFHGCELRVHLSQKTLPFYNYIEHENGTIQSGGLFVDVIKEAARAFNFSLYFNAVGAKNNKCGDHQCDFNLDNIHDYEQSTKFLFYYEIIFLTSPGELYSDAEKLFMPLKFEVWIATFVTILIALLKVQIINQLSQEVQDFVYGRNVTSPSLSIMVAFVGGAQTTLPRRNFARFLLMLFIFFSLIIRTCYQSKLFTYLQADIIKSEITTIDELIEQNDVIYAPHYWRSEDKTALARFGKVAKYDLEEHRKIFEKTFDPKFKGAVATDEWFLAKIESRFKFGKTSLKALRGPEIGVFMPFPHRNNSFLKEQFNDLIGRLHSAGLIDYWLVRFKNKPKEESMPIPLTLDHLQAGFVVSL